jgi:hypothetical protein
MTHAELVALMADAARAFDGLYRAHGGPDATRYADLSARLRTAADALALVSVPPVDQPAVARDREG